MVEYYFAHTHAQRRHLHQLVGFDIFQSLFKRKHRARNDACLVVASAGTCIGKLLGLGNIDNQVVIVHMLAHYLAHIYLLTRIDEEFSSILQFVDGIGKRCSRFHGYHRAVYST